MESGTDNMYKEKLLTRCFPKRASTKERFSDAYNSQRWRFLKSGLDDFRNGCPPLSNNIIIQGRKGPVPVILDYQKTDTSQVVPYKPRSLLIKTIHSNLSPEQRAKKDYIAQAEDLLAIYPHLEESMPPELYDDIVKLLDPEMCLTRASSSYSEREMDFPPTVQYHVKYDVQSEKRYSATLPWMRKSKNPYTWYSKKEVAAREQAAKITYIPPLDENVKRVTKEFCDWINAVGGENYNIDEATVMKLFDTRYETNYKTTAPIKIVGLYQIPAELRQCLGKAPERKIIRSFTKLTPSEPKWEKIKYGAWYLPPKTWKKRRASEQDEIPECLQVFLNLRKKIVEKEKGRREPPLHGTYAFERFLETKGYRKPAFLLQMLAANKPEKLLEDSEYASRRFSRKTYEDLKSYSFSL